MKYYAKDHNAYVVSRASEKFAAIINEAANAQIKSEMERLYGLYVRVTREELSNFIMEVRLGYNKNFMNSYFKGVGTRIPALTTDWVIRKTQGVDEQYSKKASNPELFFHGLGHFNADPRSKRWPALKDSLRTLDEVYDRRKLYNFLGAVQLQVTGPLATMEGFRRSDFEKVGDQRGDRFINTKTKKRAPQYKALKRNQFVADGVLLNVSRKSGAYGTVAGQRFAVLELNKAGLIGSELELTAFNNVLGANGAAINVYGGAFFDRLREEKGGKNDIFGASAYWKLRTNAKYGRDPITRALMNVLTSDIPAAVEEALRKEGKIR